MEQVHGTCVVKKHIVFLDDQGPGYNISFDPKHSGGTIARNPLVNTCCHQMARSRLVLVVV